MKASLRLTVATLIVCAGCVGAQSDDSDTLAVCEQRGDEARSEHPCILQSNLLDAGVQSVDGGRRRADASASASTTNGPWTSEGLPPLPPPRTFQVPEDEDVAFIARDGIGGWAFGECTSEASGAPSIADAGALPVGGGRALVCTTFDAPGFVTQMVQARDGTLYCVKGAAVRYRTISDPRLHVRVIATSTTGPWSLRATSDMAWTVTPISFSVGVVWPLWLELHYQTIDVAPAVDFRCEGVL